MHTLQSFIPQCFMPSFKIIYLLILDKILNVFAMHSHADHLGDVYKAFILTSQGG